jgi:transposase
MPARYSLDLRQRIVQACERGTHSQRDVAELFNVSLSFVEALLHYYRYSGGELIRARRRRGPPARLNDTHREQLRRWLAEQSDLTLKELSARLQARTGMVVSEPTLCRVLQQMGVRRKKRPYMPQSGTQRAYVWSAVGTAGKSPDAQSKG